jgi:Na+-driven multidrug efflux pump
MNSPNGIWWSVSIGWLMGLVIVYTYYKKGKWRGKSVIDKTKPQSI